jgi:hypothetical protein
MIAGLERNDAVGFRSAIVVSSPEEGVFNPLSAATRYGQSYAIWPQRRFSTTPTRSGSGSARRTRSGAASLTRSSSCR